ncbi:MAG: anthranilate phosphoribosyltransferase [Candidatus Bathyarchaeia archaeon]|jgi:anthranilate phosphoribosyltransferase
MIKESIQFLTDRKDLSSEQAQKTMREIMSGEATPAQIGAFLAALRMKGETVDEITALAQVMREHAIRISPQVSGRSVDTCGTGGDLFKSFNVSTTAAFVASGAGVTIAKHGNRSVTSKCGSADVLEAVGVNLNATPSTVEKSIEQIGIGFMFAPSFHPAMKNAIIPRREIGIRTVFNILGPLTNPANAKAQVLGVYDSKLVEPIANVLQKLGLEEALVVHGVDGLDEISVIGKTKIAWLRDGEVSTKEISPKDLNLQLAPANEISGFGVQENARLMTNILRGDEKQNSSRLQMVLANAAAAILVSGKVDNLTSGIEIGKEAVANGSGYDKLRKLIKQTGGDESKLESYNI